VSQGGKLDAKAEPEENHSILALTHLAKQQFPPKTMRVGIVLIFDRVVAGIAQDGVVNHWRGGFRKRSQNALFLLRRNRQQRPRPQREKQLKVLEFLETPKEGVRSQKEREDGAAMQNWSNVPLPGGKHPKSCLAWCRRSISIVHKHVITTRL